MFRTLRALHRRGIIDIVVAFCPTTSPVRVFWNLGRIYRPASPSLNTMIALILPAL
jgi:hypothetical protein